MLRGREGRYLGGSEGCRGGGYEVFVGKLVEEEVVGYSPDAARSSLLEPERCPRSSVLRESPASVVVWRLSESLVSVPYFRALCRSQSSGQEAQSIPQKMGARDRQKGRWRPWRKNKRSPMS